MGGRAGTGPPPKFNSKHQREKVRSTHVPPDRPAAGASVLAWRNRHGGPQSGPGPEPGPESEPGLEPGPLPHLIPPEELGLSTEIQFQVAGALPGNLHGRGHRGYRDVRWSGVQICSPGCGGVQSWQIGGPKTLQGGPPCRTAPAKWEPNQKWRVLGQGCAGWQVCH